MLKKAIFLELDTFCELVREITGDDNNVDDYGYEGVCVSDVGIRALEKYFDVNITSIHADDCDVVGIWIVYK